MVLALRLGGLLGSHRDATRDEDTVIVYFPAEISGRLRCTREIRARKNPNCVIEQYKYTSAQAGAEFETEELAIHCLLLSGKSSYTWLCLTSS